MLRPGFLIAALSRSAIPRDPRLYERHRLFHNYGYTPGEGVDATALLLGTALQLAAEFLVDLLCIRVEEREGIPVLDVWGVTATRRNHGAPRRRVYLWSAASGLAIAYYLMCVLFLYGLPGARRDSCRRTFLD